MIPCKQCKYANVAVTYDCITGYALSHTLTCRITHKVKSDDDTCKRCRQRYPITAA